jgi:hypothetical protein
MDVYKKLGGNEYYGQIRKQPGIFLPGLWREEETLVSRIFPFFINRPYPPVDSKSSRESGAT